jgi:hypothetical protein
MESDLLFKVRGISRVNGTEAGRVGEERCRGTIASPLVEPDVQVSRIRLSQRLSPQACAVRAVGGA